jgi:dTDP-4-amino-4,6-dideoxygalactose transaminase
MADLKTQYQPISEEMVNAVRGVFESGRYYLGDNVKSLEQEIAERCGARHGIGVNSGTDAIWLSLRALGIGKGDEVITTPFTFVATTEVIALLGAKPVYADIDPATFNLDPNLIEAKITDRTKAILPVHLYGQPAEISKIQGIADRHGLRVVYDGAQSIGAEADGKPVGAYGDAVTLSFFPTKNLGGAGDGGMITVRNPEFAEKLKLLREHGAKPKYYHSIVGTNSRLDALQAAILRVKLRHLDRWSEARARNADLYDKLFEGSRVGRPYRDPRCRHIFNQYCIRTPRRDDLRKHLTERGVGTEVYYPVPLHLQKCFSSLGYKVGDMPHSEAAANETVALPIYPEVGEERIRYVVQSVREFTDTN